LWICGTCAWPHNLDTTPVCVECGHAYCGDDNCCVLETDRVLGMDSEDWSR
jgi:hypothetical protein